METEKLGAAHPAFLFFKKIFWIVAMATDKNYILCYTE